MLQQEQEVMETIGLGANYRWYNGSSTCGWRRQEAVRRLPQALKEAGLPPLTKQWKKHLDDAVEDDFEDGGPHRLTATWQACAGAIRACIVRKEGGAEPEPVPSMQTQIRARRYGWMEKGHKIKEREA